VTPYAGERKPCRRSSFRSRPALRLLLLISATTAILLGWWPWNLLLLALIAALYMLGFIGSVVYAPCLFQLGPQL
jgi:hypothetical protein